MNGKIGPAASSLFRSRRSFVLGMPAVLAAAAASNGLWSRLLRRALAQQSSAQRLVVWYTADGTVPEWFWPAEAGALGIRDDRTEDLRGSEFNQSVPSADRPTFILQPIARYAERALLVHGLTNPGQGDHTPAVRSMLTGEALSGEQDEGDSASLDVVVGDALFRQEHVQPVLRTGVYGNRVSYNGTRDVSREGGSFVEPSWQPVADARQVLDAVGAEAPPGDSGEPDPRRQNRLALLGSVRDRAQALRCSAGSLAAQRLEAYVEQVAQLEALEQQARENTDPRIEPLVDPSDPSLAEAQSDIRQLPQVAPFVRNLALTALALDYAPVTTIQWGASGENKIEGGRLTDTRYDFLPDLEYPGAGDHGLAHPEDGAFQDAGHRITAAVSTRDRVRIFRWFSGQLAGLLDGLAAIPDGEGSLLDTTSVLCVSEFGGPNANSTAAQHSTENLPFLLVAGKSSPFRTGQFLQVERSHGDYLLTLARAFGSDVERMGVGDSLIDGIVA